MKFKHLLSTAAGIVLVSAMSFAQAHAKLEDSEPKAASQLSAAPKEIRLQFNEALEAAFSKIKLVGPGNTEIALAKQEVSKDKPQGARRCGAGAGCRRIPRAMVGDGA